MSVGRPAPLTFAARPAHHSGMDRRRFLLTSLAGALAGPLAAEAQTAGKIARVGFLHPGDGRGLADTNTTTFDLLRQGLNDLGWIEGRTILFEPRYARDEAQKLPVLAADLV